MLARLRRRMPANSPPDAGFTMAELVVSIGVIGVVMTSLMSFFVATVSVTDQQGGKQTAIQLAADGTERVRALKGSAVIGGRDRTSVDAQWATPVAGTASHLATMIEAWDSTATFPAGASAPLPTTPQPISVRNIPYQQHFFVGTCFQGPEGGECDAIGATGDVEFYRVVVAITWPDRHCTGGECAYVASTLVSGASGEPVFGDESGVPAVVIDPPGNQVGEVSVPASLLLAATGGVAPLTWSATGLPPGLTMTSSGTVSGTPTSAGQYAGSVRVADARRQVGTADFLWTVNPLPSLASPGDQGSSVGGAVSLQLVVTGGTGPFSWAATGLPPGLSLSASGLISGTPTAAGPANPVSITVTDAYGKAASASFNWTVTGGGPVTITSPLSAPGSTVGGGLSLQATATGGAAPYRWTASDLPTGLSISPTGLVTGTYATGTRFLATLRVTDAGGASAAVTLVWNVSSTGVRITAPTTDRLTDPVGQLIAFSGRATGGGARSFTWTAAGLPPGISITTISNRGYLIGILTTPGTYVVRLTATGNNGQYAVFMFQWVVSGPLRITTPAAQSGKITVPAVPVPVVASGGRGPYQWSASGLPTGVTINAATGVIAGTPTRAGTFRPRVTVRDANLRTATTSQFTWAIVAKLAVTNPRNNRSNSAGSTISVQATASGGVGPFSWSATGLPTGLTMSGTGLISGRIAWGTRYLVTVTARASDGETASVTFVWNVSTSSAYPRITAPSGDRLTDTVGQSVNLAGQASRGGATRFTWTATGLPPGITISDSGVLSGRLTTAGTSVVTLTATADNGKLANYVFTWTVR
jgi:type II secretory pathway pseudopilin PulG